MPLSLPSMSAAIVCDGKELETYDVKQEGMSSLTAFIASEAGKQFKVTFSNNLTDFGLTVYLFIDGQLIRHVFTRAGSPWSPEFLGLHNSAHSVLPFKFQELQLVDPDLEDAPAAPEMGTIELKAYRCRKRHTIKSQSQSMHKGLHKGRVSELSKKAGWHYVATGDEIPNSRPNKVEVDYLDSWTGPPYASIKISYRPRELLRAQGIIPGNDLNRQGSPINNKKRAREDKSPDPSRSRQNIKIKREELSGDAREQRIQALLAELDVLRAPEQSGTSVKHELRSPSPIVVKYSGEVVDLTLDD
ncbi:hypothetical protein EDB84DRAFT_1573692 [Lactarius hengduanensis]|nr:hypothetical protein EDB84DRAFT_1575319 [Lactarius hengduanensis]KAH9050323.1 hypothetical protein EDB84DRAFT_1573692 [Lactarius hengduanensis]